MPIAGLYPESGIRVVIERARGDAAPFRFAGYVYDPHNRFAVSAAIDAAGGVTVDAGGNVELAEKVRLLVRAACKHARDEGRPPPLRIQRWRGEK